MFKNQVIYITVKINMLTKSVSASQEFRKSLRNIRIKKVFTQVSQSQLFERRTDLSQSQDKQNFSINENCLNTPTNKINDQPFNKLQNDGQNNVEIQSKNYEYSPKIQTMQEQFKKYRYQTKSTLNRLNQSQKYRQKLQHQNTLLKQQAVQLKSQLILLNSKLEDINSSCKKDKRQDEIRDNYQQSQKYQREQMLTSFIDLHNQNSMLLQKIMKMTFQKQTKVQASVQTERTEPQSGILNEIYQISDSLSNFKQCDLSQIRHLYRLISEKAQFSQNKQDLKTSLDRYIQGQVAKRIYPMSCQIQLYEQITQNNRKSYIQKQTYLTNLLNSAHKTINNLLNEMKRLQKQSKINYSRYLAATRVMNKINKKDSEVRQYLNQKNKNHMNLS